MNFIIGLLCLFSLLFNVVAYGEDNKPSVAVMYSSLPEEILYLYDWIIVDPDTFPLKKIKEKFYMKKHGKLIAYVSIGEVSPTRSYFKQIKKSWMLGKNKVWKSFVLDLRKEDCGNFLIEKVFRPLAEEGYDGFMLDTLDSYRLILKKNEWKKYEETEIEFIKKLRKTFPKKIIIANRPFSILESIKDYIDAVLAESLFYGLDEKLSYKKMKEKETKWLLEKLNEAKCLGLPVIVIDYIPPEKKELRKLDAKRIEKLGFIPWVTDKYLQDIGEGIFHLIPRRILIVYDPSQEPDPLLPTPNYEIQMPLEWLGFVPELVEISSLPHGFLGNLYRGIIVWSGSKSVKFETWLRKRIKEGTKVFIFNVSTLRKEFLKELGIEKGEINGFDKKSIIYTAPTYGFEALAFLDPLSPKVSTKDKSFIPLIKYQDSKGKVFVPAAITSWGGYALSGTVLRSIGKVDYWVFDPFWLFKKVFGEIPALDVTTENGRRILTVHIDGDGFIDKVEFQPEKIAGEIIRDEILKKYKIPHTVSVIVGTISPNGLYPKDSAEYQEVARTIFSLPNVEPASHTFSHPFSWINVYRISKGLPPLEKDNLEYGNNLPIPNYTPSLEKEIVGSLRYITKHLCPKGKEAKVLLWSGDCLPPKEALRITYENGIYAVNGGDTTIDNTHPFLTFISPMGINRGEYFQIYAPVQNENVYTDLWKKKFGYVKVIQTFKLTEKPRRLKPISIYYHFYSGENLSSLKALKRVYNWALSQKPISLFLSEYAQKVLEFRGSAIATRGRDLVVKTAGTLRTLRIPTSWGYPDIEKSKGIVGYKKIGKWIYISFDGSGNYKLRFKSEDRNPFILVESNGKVVSFS
ncbi:MAG: endo alpha-1,4 polygalactosaminidase, partial [Desulfurobacteriaceae bacterium]